MNIFEIHTELRKIDHILQENLSELSDEQLDEIIDSIEGLELEKEAKIENTVAYYKNLDAQEKAIAEQVKRLNSRKKTLGNTKDRLKSYLSFSVPEGDKWDNGVHRVSYRKSEKVVITDESSLPDYVFKTERKPVLTEIKKELKEGVSIQGAEIQQNQNIQIK